jgi:DNA polymerase (family 10)
VARGPGLSNAEVADALGRVADLLDAQHASPHRVRAWRRGAATVRELDVPIRRLAERGTSALMELPGIGARLASAIEELTHAGRLAFLDRLEGQVSPEDLFATVPGVGEVLAERLHRALGVETLEELEVAAHDGRLERVEGFGPRRVQAVRDELAGILGRSARRRARRRRWLESGRHSGPAEARPSVATLLGIDAEYRARAERGELRQIAPRRFNPGGEAWLPVLHVDRDGWSFTALFSNTARAHELGRTRDWVVIYFERDGEEDQCTVVTERGGTLAGRRVVRGREAESWRAHAARVMSTPAPPPPD